MGPPSRIFTSYRGLGLVCNDIPMEVRYMKKRREHLIVTVVGSAFHSYGSSKLRLFSVSNPLKFPITCIASDSYFVYTATENKVYSWQRGTELKRTYSADGQIHSLLCFGNHLIGVDCNNTLILWEIDTEEVNLQMEFPANFKITVLMHPATYFNKILLGSNQGKLQLWNVKTKQMIYAFDGWGSAVTAIEQAPAQDVVAIGLEEGRIILHNLKFDETIVEFKQSWGKITTIGFRLDNAPVMITGSEMGHIAFWDLKEQKLLSQHLNAHSGPVSCIRCLPQEPLFLTNSSDNTLKMWIFDMPDGGARLLKQREGHAKPPTTIRFHGSQGDQVLSGGQDSTVRIFSTVADLLNQSLGKARYTKKKSRKKPSRLLDKHLMPPIIALVSDTVQQKSWDNVVSIHENSALVATWSVKRQKMGESKLLHDRFKNKNMLNATALCVELTFCGNFVLIGYSSGHLDKYNIQSAIWRGSYGDTIAHNDAVRGVVSDGSNCLVVSGGQDCQLKWWNMKDHKFLGKLELSEPVTKLRLHRESGLLALVLENWLVQVVDIENRTMVRTFSGHEDQISDMDFSPDSAWLVTSSYDHTIRTWDIPSSTCIDSFRTPVPASSLAFSPVGDFIATVHANHLGVYLWSNKSCFQTLPLNPLTENFNPLLAQLPSTGSDLPITESNDGGDDDIDLMECDTTQFKSLDQISEELVTLALLPTSRWLNLLQLDIIKKRNQPVQPPKVPKSAPFFIPTVPGIDFQLDTSKADSSDTSCKISSTQNFQFLSPFALLLQEKNYSQAFDALLRMGPAAVDLELRGLDPDTGGSEEVLLGFLAMVQQVLAKNKHYEAAEGYLGLFLKHHADFIMENIEATEVCQKLWDTHHATWHRLKSDFDESLCLISYLKNAALINY